MIKIQGIYKIKNLLNNKIYIGQSIDINKRLWEHKRKVIKNNCKYPLYKSIRKYGTENFEFIIIELVTDYLKLDEREQYWMDYYKSYNKEYGYNLSPTSGGSNTGFKQSEETKKKMAEARKGFKHSKESKEKMSISKKGKKIKPMSEKTKKKLAVFRLGKKLSHESKQKVSLSKKGIKRKEETKNKIAQTLKGRKLSEEIKIKISAALTGRKNKPLTEEHKRKIGLGNKGKIISEETKKKMAESAKLRWQKKIINKETAMINKNILLKNNIINFKQAI